MRKAGGYESGPGDPQAVYIQELFDAKLIRVAAAITPNDQPRYVYKVVQPDILPTGVVNRKTTDSATPVINPAGSRSGLIPAKVTDDPRITKDRG